MPWVGTYILDENHNPVPEPDTLKWAAWFEDVENRIVEQDIIDGVQISTVFLGLDHGPNDQGPPVLWETMIFGGSHHEYQCRYTSHEEALCGHAAAVRLVTSDRN